MSFEIYFVTCIAYQVSHFTPYRACLQKFTVLIYNNFGFVLMCFLNVFLWCCDFLMIDCGDFLLTHSCSCMIYRSSMFSWRLFFYCREFVCLIEIHAPESYASFAQYMHRVIAPLTVVIVINCVAYIFVCSCLFNRYMFIRIQETYTNIQ